MKRIPFFCGNWKMNKGLSDSIELAKRLRDMISSPSSFPPIEIVVAPSFLALPDVIKLLSGSLISVSAQNCFWEEKGAFTGEISPLHLKEMGCSYVIVGHFERRHLFGETDEMVAKKLYAAYSAGLRPIVCIGDPMKEANPSQILVEEIQTYLFHQLSVIFQNCPSVVLNQVVVAYEPGWAIGTGTAAPPEFVQEIHGKIRSFLKNRFGRVADELRIVYGGSVTAAQVETLLAKSDVDGALVGGASLTADSFFSIVRSQKAFP